MPTYTHNDYYGYINKIQERAIRNPQWFWSDSPDASEARQWLYNNGATSIIENIHNNTPDEIKTTINPKYLPTSVRSNNFNEGIRNTTTEAAKTIGKQALAAGAAGLTGASFLPFFTQGLTYETLLPFITSGITGGMGSMFGAGVGEAVGIKKGMSERKKERNGWQTSYLQDGIPTVEAYKKDPFRFSDNVIKHTAIGSGIGGFLGGMFGGIRGINFNRLTTNSIGPKNIFSRLNQYNIKYGNGLDYIKNFEEVPIRAGKLSNANGQFNPDTWQITVNSKPSHVLFGNIRGVISHEGQHAMQAFKPSVTIIENGYFRENPTTNIGKQFAKSLGKHQVGSWERSPDEFNSEMALMRETTRSNKPYSEMNWFNKWRTRRYMKRRFGLNDEEFMNAVDASNKADKASYFGDDVS